MPSRSTSVAHGARYPLQVGEVKRNELAADVRPGAGQQAEPHAFTGQRPRDGEADAAAGAGDNRALAAQRTHIFNARCR